MFLFPNPFCQRPYRLLGHCCFPFLFQTVGRRTIGARLGRNRETVQRGCVGRRCHFYTTVDACKGVGKPGLFLVSPVQFFTGQVTRGDGPAHPAEDNLHYNTLAKIGATSTWTRSAVTFCTLPDAARTTELGIQHHHRHCKTGISWYCASHS